MESKARKTYIYHNPSTGLIEHICEETGQIVLIQKTLDDSVRTDKSKSIRYSCDNGVECRIERGLEKLGLLRTKRWVYNDMIAELICQRVTEGETLLEICGPKQNTAGQKIMPPYFIVVKWRRERPEFDLKLKQALSDRSEILADHASEQSKLADEDNATAQKLVVDTLKWRTGVDNPDKFGAKTKISGEIEATTIFVINTGIRRLGDPGYVEPRDVGEINGKAQTLKDEAERERFKALPEISQTQPVEEVTRQEIKEAEHGSDAGPDSLLPNL